MTMFEYRLRARGDTCSVINWHCGDFNAVSPLVCSGWFVPGLVCWRSYECSDLSFLPMPNVKAYNSSLVINQRTPELIFRIVISEFRVCPLMPFLLQHWSVDLLVLVVNLHASKILGPGEYFSLYLRAVTTLCNLSDFSRSCPIVLYIM